MQYCSLQHQTLLPSPVTSTTGWCFLLWLCLFILSGVTCPLFSSSILGTCQPDELIFQYPIFLPFILFMGFSRKVSDQIRSVAQSCPTLCDPMNCSMPGLPVHHQLLEFTETHVHRVSDAIQPSHPLLSPSPPAPNPSQHQSLFQCVNSSNEVAKVLEFQL